MINMSKATHTHPVTKMLYRYNNKLGHFEFKSELRKKYKYLSQWEKSGMKTGFKLIQQHKDKK